MLNPYRDVAAVLFDAVGTLIVPRPSVAEAYHTLGARFGSRLSQQQVKARFEQAYCRHFQRPQRQAIKHQAAFDAAVTSSQHLERLRWQRVVTDVFCDVADAGQALFQELWQHFAQPHHWTLPEDVSPVLLWLSKQQYLLGIASNFDDRLLEICRQIKLLRMCPHVFHSSEIGYSKPSCEFYREVQRRLGLPAERILLVGDDPDNDLLGPRRAGWQTLLVDRSGRHRSLPALVDLRELISLLAPGDGALDSAH